MFLTLTKWSFLQSVPLISSSWFFNLNASHNYQSWSFDLEQISLGLAKMKEDCPHRVPPITVLLISGHCLMAHTNVLGTKLNKRVKWDTVIRGGKLGSHLIYWASGPKWITLASAFINNMGLLFWQVCGSHPALGNSSCIHRFWELSYILCINSHVLEEQDTFQH